MHVRCRRFQSGAAADACIGSSGCAAACCLCLCGPRCGAYQLLVRKKRAQGLRHGARLTHLSSRTFLVHASPVDWGALRSVMASEHGARGGVFFLQLANRNANAAAIAASNSPGEQACCTVGGRPAARAHDGGGIAAAVARCTTVAPRGIESPRRAHAPMLALAPDGSSSRAEGEGCDVAELQGRVLVMKPLYEGFAAAAQVRQRRCGRGGKVREGATRRGV